MAIDTIRAAWLQAPAILVMMGVAAVAQTVPLGGEAAVNQDQSATGLFERDNLLGPLDGRRAALADSGVQLVATEISESLAVAAGGDRRGAVFEGRLELDLDLDLDKLLSLEGMALHASGYQIHGRGLSANVLSGNQLTISEIEARRASRLFDLWIQQAFLQSSLSVRVGQIAADDEFFTSQYSATLINATFGWPAIEALALPGGGPAYPLATPGIRARMAFGDRFALQAAVFNGDPAGRESGEDPQLRDASGTRFGFDAGPFAIMEGSFSPDAQPGEASPATIYKLGAWYQADRFDDLYRDDTGRSLADPKTTGIPRSHNGNFGVYAMADQLLYKPAEGQDRALGGFLRLGAVPADRNFISAYVDAGLSFTGPFPGRPEDLFAVGAAYAAISGRVGALEADFAREAGLRTVTADFESAVELSYQFAVAPWWALQPDIQYIIHPTQAAAHPTSYAPSARIPDAFVVGLRSSIRF